MGLDWKPLKKPYSGYEEEYRQIFKLLTGVEKQRLKSKKIRSHDELLERFLSISSTAYETLKAPQVGKDEEATTWAESQFKNLQDKSITFDDFMQQMHGFYVLDLVPECDGLPMYIAMHDEAHFFRAQFLCDCETILGSELLEMAYESKLADETQDYANRLMDVADRFAEENKCSALKNQRKPPENDEDTPESKAHILFSAAKWLKFWSSRGHGMEADF
ncbi:hypothetical protein LVD17_23470 [Fulvivirga ulvae]|uniref:hypothetical protein n=1 Tax=Fulvivirga ulvae TaxID=2904245 RepID=UPI001F433F2A|nr:hypothetical protein [Fulvivirga ulvae]UII31255.1 hypothetical protein LVD17_23470 [Fulvivirga ulvae]